MKKHIPLALARTALCLLPVLFLSPLLFGAGGKKNCGFTTFNGACNYPNCNQQLTQCSTWNKNPNCATSGIQREAAVNLFSCVPGTAQQSCDPVLNSSGNADTTDCIIYYACVYNNDQTCTKGTRTGQCVAPYYKDDKCP